MRATLPCASYYYYYSYSYYYYYYYYSPNFRILLFCKVAKTIIAEVCPHVPRTHGDSLLHVSRIAAMVDSPKPTWHAKPAAPSELHRRIGNHIAGVINDYACIQVLLLSARRRAQQIVLDLWCFFFCFFCVLDFLWCFRRRGVVVVA